MYDIAIIGGDIRQIYMAQLFRSCGFSVTTYGLSHPMIQEICSQSRSMKEAVCDSHILVSAIPFSKDGITIPSVTSSSDMKVDSFLEYIQTHQILFAGMLSQKAVTSLKSRDIPFYDFMKEDSVAIRNGIATAEGTIMEAIRKSPGNLHNSRCLVIGFGRCGSILAGKLHGLNAHVTVAARKEEALAHAESCGFSSCALSGLCSVIGNFDFIFNTVPALVLPRNLLCHVSREAVIIDIASLPGGLDYDAAKELEINATLFLGIPGKVAPKASASILTDYVICKMKDRKKVG